MIFCFCSLKLILLFQILLVNLWNLNKWSIEPEDLGISNYVKSIQSKYLKIKSFSF